MSLAMDTKVLRREENPVHSYEHLISKREHRFSELKGYRSTAPHSLSCLTGFLGKKPQNITLALIKWLIDTCCTHYFWFHQKEQKKQNCYETFRSTHGKVWAKKSFQTFQISELLLFCKKKNHKIYPFILLDLMGQYSLFKIWRPKKCKGADWCAGTALPQDKLKRLAAPAVCSAPGVQMSKLLVNQLPNHCSLQGRLCIAAVTGVGLP